MNKSEKMILRSILSARQEVLGCSEDRDNAMIEYDEIDTIIKKLRLY